MSDTPRTDAAVWEIELCHPDSKKDFGVGPQNYYAFAVPADFARQLERELNEAKAETSHTWPCGDTSCSECAADAKNAATQRQGEVSRPEQTCENRASAVAAPRWEVADVPGLIRRLRTERDRRSADGVV